MSFYDDARQKARANKNSMKATEQVLVTDKKGYSRTEQQKKKAGKHE